MARGESFCTVLFTEPEAGSDLASLRTEAQIQGSGFRLHGRKVYNPRTSQAAHGLCAVRTGDPGDRYGGLTLFLVPLDAPGVRVRAVPTVSGEWFHEVDLDGVELGPESLLGGEGEGWEIANAMLPSERTGVEYQARARRWLEREARRLASLEEPPEADLEALGRLGAEVEAARWLSWKAVSEVAAGAGEEVAAMAKWHASTTAQRVAWQAAVGAGLAGTLTRDDPLARDFGLVELAHAEAPGLSLSAGTSEMMLQIVASWLRPAAGTG